MLPGHDNSEVPGTTSALAVHPSMNPVTRTSLSTSVLRWTVALIVWSTILNAHAVTNTSDHDDEPEAMEPEQHYRNRVLEESQYYRLERLLLTSYKPHIRPVRSYRTVTNVSLVVNVVAVHEVNEAYQTLRHSSWLHMGWRDEFLVWQPDLYDGLENIDLPAKQIWTPDVAVTNSASGNNYVKSQSDINTVVMSSGMVTWGPMSMQETMCNGMDITFYPFDSQSCDVMFSMWSSDETEVNLTSVHAVTDDGFFMDNSEWQLTGLTVKSQPYVFKDRKYCAFVVTFHLKRRRLFHTLTLIVPNILLALLAALVFALPEQCGEKVSFSMSLLLAFAVNLSVLVTAMPQSSLKVSYLMIYLTSLSVVTALSVMATVGLLRLYHRVEVVGPKVTSVILCLRRLFRLKKFGHTTINTEGKKDGRVNGLQSVFTGDEQTDNAVGKAMLLEKLPNISDNQEARKDKNPDELRDITSNDGYNKAKTTLLTWEDVAVTLDYVFFRSFVCVIVGMTSAFIITLFVGGQ